MPGAPDRPRLHAIDTFHDHPAASGGGLTPSRPRGHGKAAADTTLGGYSLIRAGSLDAAVALAAGCRLPDAERRRRRRDL